MSPQSQYNTRAVRGLGLPLAMIKQAQDQGGTMIKNQHHDSTNKLVSTLLLPSRVVPEHTILRPGTTNFGGRWLRIPTYPSVSFQVIQAISCPFSLT